jgi:uncharacterized lipoprotein YddW (UPF0748 family)
MIPAILLLVCTLDLQGVWIPRWSIDDGQRILATLDGKFNHIFLQIFALGEAYYPSNIAPARKTDDLWLKDFIRAAHERNIKVSAWVNVFYVWGFAPRTHDLRHPINLHPNWFVQDSAGGSILDLGVEAIKGRGMEGYYLAPANAQVRDHLYEVIDEILNAYDFDGIHLDYCRYPSPRYVYDVALRSSFMRTYGIDPLAFFSSNFGQRFGKWGHEDIDRCWRESIRADLTLFIKGLKERLARNRRDVMLSVAVKADHLAARRDFYQDWTEWVDSGLVDLVCLMAYQNNIRGVLASTMDAVKQPARVAVGLGIYRLGPERIREQVKQVAATPFSGVVFFSYEELKKNPAFSQVLD